MRLFALAMLLLCAPVGAKDLSHPKDCDGKVVELNPADRITVVLASSQPLADTTREFGRALYGWQGRKEFRVIVVVDLRRSLGTLFKGWTVGKMKADLDEEGERLIPWYRANKNPGNPRGDLCGIADFDGKATDSLGWGSDEKKMKVTIFGKTGDVVWSEMDADSPKAMQAEVRKLLGNPVPTPPDAVPKKSRILMRKG
jgi:hypothetical protein